MDVERSPEENRGFPILAQRHVAEPLAGERAEVGRVSGQRLLAVGNGARVALRQVADRRALVPPFGEVGSPLDDAGEERLGLRELPPLHRLDPLTEERVQLGGPRVTPDLPEARLCSGRQSRVAPPDRRERLVLCHGIRRTPAPRILLDLSRRSASLASARGKRSTSVLSGISAARANSSSASLRVLAVTERSARSP